MADRRPLTLVNGRLVEMPAADALAVGQVQIGGGPRLKANGGALEVRNAADTALAGLLCAGRPGAWPLVSGRRYADPMIAPGTSTIGATLNPDTLRAWPLWVPREIILAALCLGITTGGTVSLARLGLYADNGSGAYPGALLADLGAIGTTTTGLKRFAFESPATLAPGLYWVALNSTGGGSARSFTTSSATLAAMLGASDDLSNLYQGWSYGLAYGSLPDPFPTSATLSIAQRCIFFESS